MSAEAQAGLGIRLGRVRRSFRGWRGERPFWAGLLTLVGGIPIMYLPYANLTLGTMTIRMSTTAGAGSLIIGVLLVVLGLTMWFQKHSRVFAGVAAILLALVSLVVSNFGGFFVGFLLALIGGGLAVAWAPGEEIAAARAAAAQRDAPEGTGDTDDDTETGTGSGSGPAGSASADTGDSGSGPGAAFAVDGDGEDLFGNTNGTDGRHHRAS
jgi:hypothetical protein